MQVDLKIGNPYIHKVLSFWLYILTKDKKRNKDLLKRLYGQIPVEGIQSYYIAMSASTYKRQLEALLGKFHEQAICAQEWKGVAENRLKILAYIDDTLGDQMEALQKVGTIFGQAPDEFQKDSVDIRITSGDELGQRIIFKLTASSCFVKGLTKEATEVQSTLNHVLGVATEAISVAKPQFDHTLPQWTQEESPVSSPLKEIYEEVEDLQNVQESPDNHAVTVMDRPAFAERHDSLAEAMSLFSAPKRAIMEH